MTRITSAVAIELAVLILVSGTACSFDPSGVALTDAGAIPADAERAPDANIVVPVFVKRKILTIDGSQVPSAVTEFPVLVRIADSELAQSAQADGLDIFFRDEAGNPLPFERERYDAASGALIAWVKMDLTGADQDFYMYYGDGDLTEKATPEAVWSNDFAAAWHLDDELSGGAGSVLDSTAHGQHATPINMEAGDLVAGHIGLAIDFNNDADNEHISTPGAVTQPRWSVSAWVKRDVNGVDHDIFAFGVRSNCDPSSTQFAVRADRPRSHIGCAGDLDGTTSIEAGSFYHLFLTQDENHDHRWYVDGVLEGGPDDITNGNSLSTGNEVIGASWSANSLINYFDGIIDEVHVSSTVRSADWILTEYNNQKPDSDFVAVDMEREVVLEPRRKQLTIAGAEVPSPLAGFPVLVRITDSELAAAAHPSGLDIHFEDGDGTMLPFERERYDGVTGALLAWVKLDLTGADQAFYMYYGDGDLTEKSAPAAVWDTSFAGVWHLQQSATEPYRDSSGAGHDSTSIAGATRAAGLIGDGVDIEPASASGIVVGDVAVVGDITISAWVDADTISDWRNIVVKRDFSNERTEYALDADGDGSGNIRFYHNPDGGTWYIWEAQRAVLQTDAGWQYLSVTHRTGEAARFYVNGSQAVVGAQTVGSGSPARVAQPDVDTVLGGAMGVSGNWNWDGRLDEVHISAAVRSRDWLTAEYNNQKPDSTFLMAGAEEDL